jgi:hypothetical protein
MWSAPATVSMFATSLAEIGARLCGGCEMDGVQKRFGHRANRRVLRRDSELPLQDVHVHRCMFNQRDGEPTRSEERL